MSWPTSIPSSHFLVKSSGFLLFQMAFNGNFNITCKPGQVIFLYLSHMPKITY